MKWFHSGGARRVCRMEERKIERKGTTGSLLCNKSVYALQICAEQQRYFGRARALCEVYESVKRIIYLHWNDVPDTWQRMAVLLDARRK